MCDTLVCSNHALIQWNGGKEAFEIRCLSKQSPIYLNGVTIAHTDGFTVLHSKDVVQVLISVPSLSPVDSCALCVDRLDTVSSTSCWRVLLLVI